MDEEEIKQRLASLKKVLAKKQRKLQKIERVKKAKQHVRKRIEQQNEGDELVDSDAEAFQSKEEKSLKKKPSVSFSVKPVLLRSPEHVDVACSGSAGSSPVLQYHGIAKSRLSNSRPRSKSAPCDEAVASCLQEQNDQTTGKLLVSDPGIHELRNLATSSTAEAVEDAAKMRYSRIAGDPVTRNVGTQQERPSMLTSVGGRAHSIDTSSCMSQPHQLDPVDKTGTLLKLPSTTTSLRSAPAPNSCDNARSPLSKAGAGTLSDCNSSQSGGSSLLGAVISATDDGELARRVRKHRLKRRRKSLTPATDTISSGSTSHSELCNDVTMSRDSGKSAGVMSGDVTLVTDAGRVDLPGDVMKSSKIHQSETGCEGQKSTLEISQPVQEAQAAEHCQLDEKQVLHTGRPPPASNDAEWDDTCFSDSCLIPGTQCAAPAKPHRGKRHQKGRSNLTRRRTIAHIPSSHSLEESVSPPIKTVGRHSKKQDALDVQGSHSADAGKEHPAASGISTSRRLENKDDLNSQDMAEELQPADVAFLCENSEDPACYDGSVTPAKLPAGRGSSPVSKVLPFSGQDPSPIAKLPLDDENRSAGSPVKHRTTKHGSQKRSKKADVMLDFSFLDDDEGADMYSSVKSRNRRRVRHSWAPGDDVSWLESFAKVKRSRSPLVTSAGKTGVRCSIDTTDTASSSTNTMETCSLSRPADIRRVLLHFSPSPAAMVMKDFDLPDDGYAILKLEKCQSTSSESSQCGGGAAGRLAESVTKRVETCASDIADCFQASAVINSDSGHKPLSLADIVITQEDENTMESTNSPVTCSSRADAEIREFRISATSSTTSVVEDAAEMQNSQISADANDHIYRKSAESRRERKSAKSRSRVVDIGDENMKPLSDEYGNRVGKAGEKVFPSVDHSHAEIFYDGRDGAGKHSDGVRRGRGGHRSGRKKLVPINGGSQQQASNSSEKALSDEILSPSVISSPGLLEDSSSCLTSLGGHTRKPRGRPRGRRSATRRTSSKTPVCTSQPVVENSEDCSLITPLSGSGDRLNDQEQTPLSNSSTVGSLQVNHQLYGDSIVEVSDSSQSIAVTGSRVSSLTDDVNIPHHKTGKGDVVRNARTVVTESKHDSQEREQHSQLTSSCEVVTISRTVDTNHPCPIGSKAPSASVADTDVDISEFRISAASSTTSVVEDAAEMRNSEIAADASRSLDSSSTIHTSAAVSTDLQGLQRDEKGTKPRRGQGRQRGQVHSQGVGRSRRSGRKSEKNQPHSLDDEAEANSDLDKKPDPKNVIKLTHTIQVDAAAGDLRHLCAGHLLDHDGPMHVIAASTPSAILLWQVTSSGNRQHEVPSQGWKLLHCWQNAQGSECVSMCLLPQVQQVALVAVFRSTDDMVIRIFTYTADGAHNSLFIQHHQHVYEHVLLCPLPSRDTVCVSCTDITEGSAHVTKYVLADDLSALLEATIFVDADEHLLSMLPLRQQPNALLAVSQFSAFIWNHQSGALLVKVPLKMPVTQVLSAYSHKGLVFLVAIGLPSAVTLFALNPSTSNCVLLNLPESMTGSTNRYTRFGTACGHSLAVLDTNGNIQVSTLKEGCLAEVESVKSDDSYKMLHLVSSRDGMSLCAASPSHIDVYKLPLFASSGTQILR